NVARLVREHADDLVRRLRFHQRAAVDEDAAAVGNESIERTIVDDDDLDILLGKTRRAQDGLRIVPQQLLDLRVAADGRSFLFLRACRSAGAAKRGGGHKRNEARRWRRPTGPDRSL